MTRARYHIVTPRPAPNVVAITDMYDDLNPSMSVTNDAEAVVDQLKALGVLRAGDRLIYRDTEHRWDEIVLTPELSFKGFAPIGAAFVCQAVKFMNERASQ